MYMCRILKNREKMINKYLLSCSSEDIVNSSISWVENLCPTIKYVTDIYFEGSFMFCPKQDGNLRNGCEVKTS